MDPIFDVLVMVRWIHFGAVFLLFGATLFWFCAPGDAGEEDASSRRFGRRCLQIAAPVALVTGVAWLAATIVNMTGGLDGLRDPDTLHAFFFETMFGPVEAVRMALLVILVLLVLVAMPERLRLALVLVASALLLVSQAWLGHAAEGGDTLRGTAMIAIYAVHVLAGAAWLGALPVLLARAAELRGSVAPPGALYRLLSRVSLVATIAVGLIVASGVANAAFRVHGRFGAFVATPYGDILAVKVALVGLMLGFAAYNRLIAMPRLRFSDRCEPNVIRGTAVSIGCEIVLGGAVLLAAAILGITPPPAG